MSCDREEYRQARELAEVAVAAYNKAHEQLLRIWRRRAKYHRISAVMALVFALVGAPVSGTLFAIGSRWLGGLGMLWAAVYEVLSWRGHVRARDLCEGCVALMERRDG